MAIFDKNVKMVLRVQTGYSVSQVRDYIVNTVWPDMRTKANELVSPHVTDLVVEKKLKTYALPNGQIEMYPKFRLQGTTALSEPEAKQLYADVISECKTIFHDHLVLQGATLIFAHWHTADGGFVDQFY